MYFLGWKVKNLVYNFTEVCFHTLFLSYYHIPISLYQWNSVGRTLIIHLLKDKWTKLCQCRMVFYCSSLYWFFHKCHLYNLTEPPLIHQQNTSIIHQSIDNNLHLKLWLSFITEINCLTFDVTISPQINKMIYSFLTETFPSLITAQTRPNITLAISMD